MILSALLLLGTATVDAPVEEAVATEPPAYTIRAPISLASRVNQILAQVAKPAVTVVEDEQDPLEFLREHCGRQQGVNLISVARAAGKAASVRHTPCLRYAYSAPITILSREDYVDRLSRIFGLAGWRGNVETRRGNDAPWRRLTDPTALQANDEVRFADEPQWIDFTTNQAVISSREELVREFGDAFGCDGEAADVEICLHRIGVSILNGSIQTGTGRAASGLDEDDTSIDGVLPIAAPQPGPNTEPEGAAIGPSNRPEAAPNGSSAEEDGTTGLDVSQIGPNAEDSAADVRVADEQWPFDPVLLARVLEQSQLHTLGPQQTVSIGVIDSGLGRTDGYPLPESAFERSWSETANGRDDDHNNYRDDILGASAIRSADGDRVSEGSISLCGSYEAFGDFIVGNRQRSMDHGAIVASIAAGVPLRPFYANPFVRLIFFRTLDDQCALPIPQHTPPEQSLADGLRYMAYTRRTKFVVMSVRRDNPSVQVMMQIRGMLAGGRIDYLILPAGNDGPGDLDGQSVFSCLACHSRNDNNSDWRHGDRIIVVGAANSNLTIAPYSNYGEHTVTIYAPGEPTGAETVTGADPEIAYGGATSWAAPYVALAMGTMRALGMQSRNAIRERLLLSTWELADDRAGDGQGILNLAKAFAVQHIAIEVAQRDENGRVELRTFVGPAQDQWDHLLTPCSSRGAFSRVTLSIRFDQSADRLRSIRLTRFDGVNGVFLTDDPISCLTHPTIQFTDLAGRNWVFDTADVRQILFPSIPIG